MQCPSLAHFSEQGQNFQLLIIEERKIKFATKRPVGAASLFTCLTHRSWFTYAHDMAWGTLRHDPSSSPPPPTHKPFSIYPDNNPSNIPS